jgi:O-antigen/teichoic acid export membrane protein
MSVSSDDLSSLLASTTLILVGIVLTSVSQLLERVLVARTFGPDVYGEVAMGLAIMTIGTTVSLVGLNQGISRYVSRFDDERDVRGAWWTGIGIGVPLSLLVAVALLWNADRIGPHLFETDASGDLLALFVLVIPVHVGLTVSVSTFRGLENTRYKLYAKDLLQPGVRLVLIAGAVTAGVGIAAVGYAYLAAGVAALMIAAILSNRVVDLVGPTRFRVREMLTFSAPLLLSALLSVLLTRMDTLMVGYFRTSTEVGLYSAAYPLANSLLMVLSAFGYLYLPLTSRLDADGKSDEVGGIYRLTTKWMYVITFPAFVAFLAFPGDVLSLFFGAAYADGGIALAILSVGFFTSAALGRNRSTLTALGHTPHILGADVLTLALNLALNLLLIPAYGFVGAAVASVAAYVTRNVALSTVLYLKSDISPFSPRTVSAYVALPATVLPLGVALSNYLTLTAVTLPLFLVFAGLLCLIVVAAVGSLQSEDIAVVTFVEESAGIEVPMVREFIPDAED